MQPKKRPSRRIKFQKADVEQLEDGSWEANVTLAWPDSSQQIDGKKENPPQEGDAVRSSAEATVAALSRAIDNRAEIGLLAVQELPELDAVVVVLSMSDEKRVYRLTGSCSINDMAERAAALAVLDATNRLLEGFQE